MKSKSKKNLLLLLLIIIMGTGRLFAQSNLGTDFWVTFGTNAGYSPALVTVQIRIVAKHTSTVTFSFTDNPLLNPVPVNVSANTIYTFDFDASRKAAVYNSGIITGVSNRSLHITSTDSIAVYALNQAIGSTDATNVLPVEAWGLEYYHIGYQPLASLNDGYSVIAQEPDTKVYMNGTQVAALNTGEVYAYFSTSDLTGCQVTSDKSVAYFAHIQGVNIPSGVSFSDNMFQQLPPVDQWGTHFVIPNTIQEKARIRVLAAQNGTTITQVGATVVAGSLNLNAGQFVELEILNGDGCYIVADKPVGVCSYMVGGDYTILSFSDSHRGDPAEAWIAPIEQTMRNVLVAPFNPEGDTELTYHYVVIITSTSGRANTTVSIDGATPVNIASSITWKDNVGGSGYSFGSYEFPSGGLEASYLFDNSNELFIMGYGTGSAESYYYLAGSAAKDLNTSFTVNGESYLAMKGKAYCDTSDFEFIASFSGLYPSSIIWTLDGTVLTDFNNSLTAYAYGLSGGMHTISLSVPSGAGYKTLSTHFFVGGGVVVWTPEANTTGTSVEKQDWNNSDNWTPNVIPSECLDVYIPGNSECYPTLNDTINARCHNIYFHFGGEVAKPHLLTYNKAFVEYNFGYFSGSTYTIDGDPRSAVPMVRGRWYALAAPLNKIAPGDFSFGGKPDAWQQGFIQTTNGGSFIGQWATPHNANATNVPEDQYGGIAVWMADVVPGSIGEDVTYQTNLNALQGLIWMPYFEDPATSTLHRIHQYTGGESRFYYYYNKDPGQPISSQYDAITRGNEAYRFVFDGKLDNVLIDGTYYPTYRLEVPAGKELMIGNPFLSNLDFNKFYEINQLNLANPTYRVYDDTGWTKHYTVGSGGAIDENIAPLQAFFIQTAGSGTVELLFPPDLVSVTKPDNKLRASEPGMDYDDVLYIEASNSKGSSWLTLGMKDGVNVDQLFNNDTLYAGAPQLYFASGEHKHAVHFLSREAQMHIGVRSQSNEKITLKFKNTEKFNTESLMLQDYKSGEIYDLLSGPAEIEIDNDPGDSGDSDRLGLFIGIMPLSGSLANPPNAGSIHVSRNPAIVAYTPTELVEKIFVKGGSCSAVSNVTLKAHGWDSLTEQWTNLDGSNRGLGHFTRGTSGFEMEEGLVLSTGGLVTIEGPNSGSNSVANSLGSQLYDDDLQTLVPNVTNVSVLEFDFVPVSDTIQFRYVFASEEYSYYVRRGVNDVFGFFISGPGITGGNIYGNKNIATLPTTTSGSDIVSIDNVNAGQSSDYNVHNCPSLFSGPTNEIYYVNIPGENWAQGGSGCISPVLTVQEDSLYRSMEFNGRTVLLTATQPVTPCLTYHLKLAIGNVSDQSLQSGVFLEAHSFDLGDNLVNWGSMIEGNDIVYRGCTTNKFVVSRTQAGPAPYPVPVSYSGSVAADVTQLDYSALPDTVVIPANQLSAEVYYVVNTPPTGPGTFVIHCQCPCGTDTYEKEINVYDQSPLDSLQAVGYPACPGPNDGWISIITGLGGSGYYESSIDGGLTWQMQPYDYTGLTTGNYTVNIRDAGNCNMVTRNVTISSSINPGTLSGLLNVCANTSPGQLSGSLPAGGAGSYSYQWEQSADGNSWSAIIGAITPDYLPGNLPATTYFRRIATDTQCGSAYSDTLKVTVAPLEAWWNKSADNSNWNDPANWTNAGGTALNAIPLQCTDVHIPGNETISHYPSLDSINTVRNAFYYDPECHDIYFHFGGEVAKPQLLTYNKAFIDYNFGYYSGASYQNNGDQHSATAMLRGRWYGLATPLSKITPGDFSFGGKPDAWQQAFVRNDIAGSFVGQWEEPHNANATDIPAEQYGGIAVWMAAVEPGVIGSDVAFQDSLNALQGIIRMPYFEDATVSSLHRIHQYVGGASEFYYYYNLEWDQPISTQHDDITRGGEAYRFVFDGKLVPVNINGTFYPTLQLLVPGGKELMIGNPFLSSLDFDEFYEINKYNLANNTYQLYVNNTWVPYTVGSGGGGLPSRYIAPLQAFFIETGGSSSFNLLFPPDLVSVTNPGYKLKASGMEDVYDNVLYIEASNGEGSSWATLGMKAGIDVDQLVNNDMLYVNVPQIYLMDGNRKNIVQFISGDRAVPIGIRSQTNEMITLRFKNMERFNAESLVLLDKVSGTVYDLLRATNEIQFNNLPDSPDRFLLHVGKQTVVTEATMNNSGVLVRTERKKLFVEAGDIIQHVKVVNMQGITLLNRSFVNSNSFSTEMIVPSGIYIVNVMLANGESRVEKIIVN